MNDKKKLKETKRTNQFNGKSFINNYIFDDFFLFVEKKDSAGKFKLFAIYVRNTH